MAAVASPSLANGHFDVESRGRLRQCNRTEPERVTVRGGGRDDSEGSSVTVCPCRPIIQRIRDGSATRLGALGLSEDLLVRVHYGGPDWTKSRTEADSDFTPSDGMGMVYVRTASSSTISMPCTKLRRSAFRSGKVPFRR